MPSVTLTVVVVDAGRRTPHSVAVQPNETLRDVFQKLDRAITLIGPADDWQFTLGGRPLDLSTTASEIVLLLLADPDAELLLDLMPSHLIPPQTRGQAAAGAPAGRPAPKPAPPLLPRPAAPASRRREEAESELRSDEIPMPKRKRAAPADVSDDEDADDLADAVGTSRQATVRYYHRMNPQRVYPFLVVLSKEEIAEIVQAGVKQATGERFAVAEDVPVEVEPVLPGCQVYPPRHTLVIGPDTQTLEFWVVPQVLGQVKGAKVIVRQGGETLSEVQLNAAVVKQTAAVVVGTMSFVMPYVTKSLKTEGADQSPYQAALNWVANHLRPEFIGLGLLALAVGLYFWCRPRKRDQFWDVSPKE